MLGRSGSGSRSPAGALRWPADREQRLRVPVGPERFEVLQNHQQKHLLTAAQIDEYAAADAVCALEMKDVVMYSVPFGYCSTLHLFYKAI